MKSDNAVFIVSGGASGLGDLARFHAHALAVQASALAAAIVGAGDTAAAFAMESC